ncbi:HTTM domain-containing protein [Crocosphaera sp.]|uniref:HTTM domain-containing protein n=1 Tax=Crocosphaera sp. TaxID=2729996 RepID=UPI003F20B61F|nr:Vitamin K-dependent gamma-carboxylase [Crocosphaera sp.]
MQELIKNAAKKLYNFWFAKESTLSLGVFRIVFGLFILNILLLSYFHWNEYYGVHGIVSLERFINARGGWFLASLKSIFALSNNPQFIWVIYGLGLGTTFCFIIGFGTRIVTIILYIFWFSLCNRNSAIIDSKDIVIQMLLFYSCFATLGNSLSVDNIFRAKLLHKRRNILNYIPPKQSVWALRLLQISIALIYPLSAIDKLYSDIAWRDGSIMYYVSLYDAWFRFTDVDLFHNYFLSIVTTYSALILEFFFPIFVWFKRTKYWILSMMALFHISIAIVMNEFVLQFSLVMLISYTLFLDAEVIKKVASKFKKQCNLFTQKLLIENKVNS